MFDMSASLPFSPAQDGAIGLKHQEPTIGISSGTSWLVSCCKTPRRGAEFGLMRGPTDFLPQHR